MPSIKDQSTVEAIAREYCSNGRDKAQAMRTIGYAESSCKSGQATGDVYGNLRVKAAIAHIDAKQAQIGKRTVENLDEMYQDAYDQSKSSNQPSAMVSAVTGIARLYGMDKDVQVKDDAPEPLSDTELAIARDQAQRVTRLKLA